MKKILLIITLAVAAGFQARSQNVINHSKVLCEYPGGHTWPVWRNNLFNFAQLLFK
jgi:enterochelin esterase-like enzyme